MIGCCSRFSGFIIIIITLISAARIIFVIFSEKLVVVVSGYSGHRLLKLERRRSGRSDTLWRSVAHSRTRDREDSNNQRCGQSRANSEDKSNTAVFGFDGNFLSVGYD